MKYKVGDQVKIQSLDWYNENKDEYGYVRCIDFLFTPEHSKYCGCEFTISHITEFQIPSYIMENNGHEWTDEMIEGLVEEEDLIPKFGEYSDDEPLNVPKMTTEFIKEIGGLPCPEGYIFKDENGNVINATKIVLEKKKKEYPKTYEECAKVLLDRASVRNDFGYKGELLVALQKLLVCRDAYWKIAGDEMGLGKPWEPDWDNVSDKYCIYFVSGEAWSKECQTRQCPFAFPTPEMRDAFRESFDKDLE